MDITDVHAHLDDEAFRDDLQAVLARARNVGVRRFICVGTRPGSSRDCLALAGRHPGRIYAAVGIHPNYWAEVGPDDWGQVEELAELPGVVAVGETGLDFHHDHTPRQAQADAFARHIALARRSGKPLIVHCRKADDAVLAILADAGPLRGVRHCFDRPLPVAQAYIELGFHISVGAAVTRPGYVRLKKALRAIPLDRLLLETDCPYQAPVSHAGERNEPAFITLTLEALAALRGMKPAELAEVTTRNAQALFGLDAHSS